MSDKPSLLPCPFCGSEDVSLDRVIGRQYFAVSCNACSAMSQAGYPRDEAIAAWNRRTHRPDPALRVALEWIAKQIPHFWIAFPRPFGPNKGRDVWIHDFIGEVLGKETMSQEEADALLAALSASPTTPQYDEAALDRFAEAGKQAWANPPESAKLIRQVDPTGDSEAKKDGERLDCRRIEYDGYRFLEVGERIEHGDEVFTGGWHSANGIIGQKVMPRTGKLFDYMPVGNYRRKLDAARSRGEGKE